ncbi:hypothetical protein P5X00_02795 [Paraburkholderia sp. A2RO-4L]
MKQCRRERNHGGQELAHIKGAIGLLEQTRTYLTNPTRVSDTAYWRIRLSKVRERFERDKALELQIDELLVRLQHFERSDSVRE